MTGDLANTAKHVFINQIQPGMKNINTTFIVLDMGSVHKTQNGADLRTVRIADQSGSINLCLWNEQSEHIALKKVFSIRNGFSTVHKGRLSLSFAKSGEISKPLDISIQYSETPDMSVYSAENDIRPPMKRPLDEDGQEVSCRKPTLNDVGGANKYITIHQLQPGMRSVNLHFIVTDIDRNRQSSGIARQTSQLNEVRTIRVADHTGSVLMSVWNELGEFVKTGDILRLRGGYVTVFKGSMGLQVGKTAEVLKTGEFFMPFTELPDMSAFNKDLLHDASALASERNGAGGAVLGNGAPPTKVSREEPVGI